MTHLRIGQPVQPIWQSTACLLCRPFGMNLNKDWEYKSNQTLQLRTLRFLLFSSLLLQTSNSVNLFQTSTQTKSEKRSTQILLVENHLFHGLQNVFVFTHQGIQNYKYLVVTQRHSRFHTYISRAFNQLPVARCFDGAVMAIICPRCLILSWFLYRLQKRQPTFPKMRSNVCLKCGWQ